MSFTGDRLYELLPMIYRVKDGEQGEPLRALLDVIGEQIAGIEENLEQLYDDQFIETCADWVVPYLGGLLGYESLHGVNTQLANQRAEVANTIGYRRRKGTVGVLEQLAADVTDWPTRAVEFFQRLQWHQHLNHLRPHHYGTPDLRETISLQYLDTAFDTSSRSVDVRSIETDDGQYNIPSIGLFVWRLKVYCGENSTAVGLDDRRFFFSPWGNDMQLFTRPEAERKMEHLAEPIETPMALSLLLLYRLAQRGELSRYYGPDKSFFVRVNSADIDVSDIHICSLESDTGSSWEHLPYSGVAVDPQLGRLALGTAYGSSPAVEVTYHYTFSDNMGGGDYERAISFEPELTPGETVHAGQTVQSRLALLPGHGVLEITDNSRYEESLTVTSSASEVLEIRARNEARPVCILEDDLTIDGGPDSVVILNGLWLGGARVHVPADSSLKKLVIRHCTLVPGLSLDGESEPLSGTSPAVVVESPETELVIERTIIGGIRLHRDSSCSISDTIVDATATTNVAFADPDHQSAGGVLTLTNSTVVGKIHTRRFDLVSNTLLDAGLAPADTWLAPIMAELKQQGCMRFSYVPPSSRTPRRYRCQPDRAIFKAIEAAQKENPVLPALQKAAIAELVSSQIRPVWTTQRYGEPAYMQLAGVCPDEIRTGADDDSEMGAFHDLYQPQRLSNLRVRLREYLRFGLEAGVIYMS